MAIIVLMHHRRYRRAIPLLFHDLKLPDTLVGGAASAALALIGGESVLVGLEKMLIETPSDGLRERVVSALAQFNGPSLWRKTASILTDLLDSRTESADSRTSAAEGLANALGEADKRSTIFRRAVKSLIRALDDASPDVRCCAAYALGQLEAKAALPVLARLAKHDRGHCRGIGPVRTEARDAMARIRYGRYSVDVAEIAHMEDQRRQHVDAIKIRSVEQ